MTPRKSRRLKVEIIDDNDSFLRQWRKALGKGAAKSIVDISQRTCNQIREDLKALDSIRRIARKEGGNSFRPEASPFSDIDIVFVDYDLIDLEDATCLTGEDIAYLLRCFTTCTIVVLMNSPELGVDSFDLRLRRPMDSWADLAIGSEQLDNKWLWDHTPRGFAPWTWPNLAELARKRRDQISAFQDQLNESILDVLDFPVDARIAMDHAMADVVATRRDGEAEPYSVKEFVLESEYCVHRRDRAMFQDHTNQIARIAAARTSNWLEHVVLPAQSVLVDAAHLVTRFPGLLKAKTSLVGTWRAAARRDATVLKALNSKAIAKYRLSSDKWLSRPAWLWPQLRNDPDAMKWAAAEITPRFVFCEDTSRFIDRKEGHEFVADVPAQTALRYLEMPTPLKEYRPSVRLSM